MPSSYRAAARRAAMRGGARSDLGMDSVTGLRTTGAGRTLAVTVAAILVMGTVMTWIASSNARAAPRVRNGGFVDSVLWYEQPNQAQALIDLEGGTMDIYMFPLRTLMDIQAAKANPNLATIDSGGLAWNLFLNPVPINETLAPGMMNPFALEPVRQAMNYLIDRKAVVSQVLGGFGSSHTTLWAENTPEFARDARFYTELSRNYSHDFQRAWTLVNESMTKEGATWENGTWTWKGAPVALNFVIRTEDVRRNIGDYVADTVQALGFPVNRLYRTGGAAFAIVYNGPPDIGAWHLYTEGWSFAWLVAWPDSYPHHFYNGGEGSIVWSYYAPEPELSDVALALLNRNFASLEERQSLVERAAELALANSVRVWLVSGLMVTAYSKRVTALAYDLGGGPWSLFSVRTARFANPGGLLQVGQRIQFLSAYQPWRGFGWTYDRLVQQAFADPGVWPHPHTGTYIPIRSNFTVSSAGPSGQLDVPGDAVRYDATANVWESVPAGSKATSKVVFNYTLGSWHHGVPMSMDDVLYEIALVLRRDRGDIAAKDPDAASPDHRLFADTFRGLRIVNQTDLEVYVDFWHVDPTAIAATASVFPSTPWEASELGMATVLADETRISEITASNEGKDALDLVKGPSLAYLDGHLSPLKGANHRPPGADTYPGGGITDAEATERWTAVDAWRTAWGHYYPSNGPFFVAAVDEPSRQVTLRTFADYPFPADRWDSLLSPRIPEVAIDPIPDVLIGSPATINVTTTLGGQPYDSVTVEYLIGNASGAVVLRGRASHEGIGEWPIELSGADTASLRPGAHTVEVIAVGAEAVVPAFGIAAFSVVESLETDPPVSTVAPLGRACSNANQVPFLVVATADDPGSGVASVELFASYSVDGASWTAPQSLGVRTGPFEWSFDPAALSGDGWYRLTSIATDARGNVEDIGGKPNGDLEFRVDTTPPLVLATVPSPGQTGVDPSAPVVITFGEAMDPSGPFSLMIAPDIGVLLLVWSTDETQVTVSFAPAAYGTMYTATLTEAADACGNPLGADFAWQWTTAAAPDTVAPTSSARLPGTYWQRTGPVSIATTATDDRSGVAKVDLYASFSIDGLQWSAAALAATSTAPPFTFLYDPEYGDGLYRLWTIATDETGNVEPWAAKPASGEAAFGFDTKAPTVTSSSPAPAALDVPVSLGTIRIVFSEAVDHPTAEAAFRIQPAVSGTLSWEGDTLVFTPDTPLQEGTEYEVRILAGIPDRAGNLLEADFVLTFRTAAQPRPADFVETWGIPLAVAAVATAAVVALLLLRRRGRRGPESGNP